MIIGNANVFVDGKFQKGSVAVENGVITAIGPAGWACDVDAQGKYLVPGFIDVHTHGAMNEDFSDGKPEGLPAMAKHYAALLPGHHHDPEGRGPHPRHGDHPGLCPPR